MLKRKKTRRDGINWKKIIFLYVLFGFLCYKGFIFLLTTDYFLLKEVEVDGTKVLLPEYVVSISKLRGGISLFLINTNKVKDNIKKDPWIEDVVVKKYFPHTIYIFIKERVPFCILTNGKKNLVLNDEGIVLTEKADHFSFLRKIIWRNMDFPKNYLGKKIENKWIYDSIYIIKIFDKNFPGLLKGLIIDKSAYIKIFTKNGISILLGSIDDILNKEKFAMLKEILNKKTKNIKVLDLRYKKGIIGK